MGLAAVHQGTCRVRARGWQWSTKTKELAMGMATVNKDKSHGDIDFLYTEAQDQAKG